MIGIYKITSPSGKVYIGQSRDIYKRFNDYKKLNNCREQIRLHRSFLKHGVDSHIFEIIEECELKQLNIRERFWQDKFDVIDKNGLNCHLTNTNELVRVDSIETKKRKSLGAIKRGYTKEHIELLRLKNLGKTVSKETRKKLSEGRSGNRHWSYGKISPLKNRKLSEEHKVKIKISSKPKFGENNKNSKIVIDLQTGVFYNSVTEISKLYNIPKNTLTNWLRGEIKNKTNFSYA